MRRLILLLVVAGGAYWSWSSGQLAAWLTPPGEAQAAESELLDSRMDAGMPGDPQGIAPGVEDVPGGGFDAGQVGSLGVDAQGLGALGRLTPKEFAEAVQSGRPEALQTAFRVSKGLQRAGAAYAQDAALIGDAAARFAASSDLDAAVDALGAGNSFLHTEAGRRLAVSLIERVQDQPDERAVKLYTAMLERCMRGDLDPADTAALGVVKQIYAAHRRPLRNHLCNPTILARAKSYRVKRGDSLAGICRKFRKADQGGLALSDALLGELNRIHNISVLQIDQVLKVPVDPVVTVIEKRSFLMALYVGDVILRMYRIGHGAEGRTPVTEFRVAEKLKNPDWYAPDGNRYPHGHPQNILGGYFIKLKHDSFQGFGVHGTPHQDSIGQEGSAGCIRMLDDDIRDYFSLVPRGTRLVIKASRG